MPPDLGGSSVWVRNRPACNAAFPVEQHNHMQSLSSIATPSVINPHHLPPSPPCSPSTMPTDGTTKPLAIPTTLAPLPGSVLLPPTPPTSPPEYGSVPSAVSAGAAADQPTSAAFLSRIFPGADVRDAEPVSITSEALGCAWEGAVLRQDDEGRALFLELADGKGKGGWETVDLRESVVAVLELAEECLDCTALVICLKRSEPDLDVLLHSLMYCGGTIVTKPPFEVDPKYICVGLEI